MVTKSLIQERNARERVAPASRRGFQMKKQGEAQPCFFIPILSLGRPLFWEAASGDITSDPLIVDTLFCAALIG